MRLGMGPMIGGMGAWMLLWGLVGLLVLALAAFGLVWIVHVLTRRRNDEPAPVDTPLEILRRRYAAGEIDEDEYLLHLAGLSQR